ncbi:MAG: hypothetical protein ACYSYM_08130, partial [Planctomycetota bacterium]
MYDNITHCTRREFVAAASTTLASAALAGTTAGRNDPDGRQSEMRIGFHTDAFNSSYWNFEKCLEWAQSNGVHFIECGLIDGVSW